MTKQTNPVGRPPSPYLERIIKIRCTADEYKRIIKETDPRTRVEIITKEIEMDRIDELNILDEIADCISYYNSTESTAEELVEYYESNESMPEWYDSHDRKQLIKKVSDLIK